MNGKFFIGRCSHKLNPYSSLTGGGLKYRQISVKLAKRKVNTMECTTTSSNGRELKPEVRLKPRADDGSEWGELAHPQAVCEFKDALRLALHSRGFESRVYGENKGEPGSYSGPEFRSCGCLAEAFFKGEAKFRHEALLIDDGGRQVDGRKVLSVAVRKAHTENAELRNIVFQMLSQHGINPIRAQVFDAQIHKESREADSTTDVFRIQRLPRISFAGILSRTRDTLRGLWASAAKEPATGSAS